MKGFALAILAIVLALGAASTSCAQAPAPTRIEIADPRAYWRDQGFVELTPAIRVSVAPGARTAIYLKIPEGARIGTRLLPAQGRATLILPPGSASDRVSLAASADGEWTVDDVRGTRWGGNLCMVTSLLGTRHWPRVKGGVLFLEDVNEHPYRVERMLLQLQQAGVLDAQRAVLLGAFSDWRKSPLDRGYSMKTVLAEVRRRTPTPILAGLPFGHVPTKVCLPVGARVTLAVQGREVLLGW